MKTQFVSYEIALALTELGFNEISRFGSESSLYNSKGKHLFYTNYGHMYSGLSDGYIYAPLWQQIIDWFRNEYNFHIEIQSPDDSVSKWSYSIHIPYRFGSIGNGQDFSTYEQTREQAILKAIELIKSRQL